MTQLAEIAEGEQKALDLKEVDLKELTRVAEDSLINPRYAKAGKSSAPMKVDQSLELLDCFIAPCTVGCPIHQDIPEYIRLIGEERYAEAFELIIAKNPLPFITGYICDHNCQLKCVRNDYEDSVQIRDLKHIAAEKGYAEIIDTISPPEYQRDIQVAVIGAGPAGISAGYFLAREGFQVTVFDKMDRPGGMVAHGIPDFRYPKGTVEKDVELARRVGVKFEMNSDPTLDISALKTAGFTYIVLAIGAWKSRLLTITGEQDKVRGAIDFLHAYKKDPASQELGTHVVVIGGGNSAMDSARAAKRVLGVETVSILYRRTIKQMPADREELENAVLDGVIFHELVNPISLENGILTCQVMELGEVDASGRRRPVPVKDQTVTFPADSVLTAIGELVEYDLLEENGIALDENGNIQVDEYNQTSLENVFITGDAFRGPATVVEGIADARKAVNGILELEGTAQTLLIPQLTFDRASQQAAVAAKKAFIHPQVPKAEFEQSYHEETERCLECNYLCDKCVEVCPNRANIAIQVDSPLLRDKNQVLHMDALCNECGNCATFCPYQGSPYLDKFTVFWDEEAFLESANEGYLPLPDDRVRIRYQGEDFELKYDNGHLKAPDMFKGDDQLRGVFEIMLTVRERYPYLEAA